MAAGTTVSLELLIQATNSASKEVVRLKDQLNELAKSSEQFGKKSQEESKKSKRALSDFEKGVNSYTSAVKKATDATKGFGTAGTWLLGIAASLSATAFFPIKSAADFEQALSGVIAVTDGAKDSIDALKATASELGRTTKFTAQEAAVGMQYLGQAGFDAGEVVAGIGPSLQLAVAAAVDLGQAANIATNVLSGMRLPVSSLQTVVDVLAKTAAESNAELLDMADALSYAGPIAASVGVGVEDLASVVGVLGNAGIQGSRAGTALRGTLFALTKPTGEAANALERLGVNIELGADGSLDLVDAFHQLADAGITAADAQEIFGRYASAGVLAITSQIDALDDMIESNYAAAGAAQDMADTMKDNLKGAITELFSALDGLRRAFGDPLLGPIRLVVKALTSIVSTMAGVVEKFPIATKILGTFAGVVVTATAVLGAFLLAIVATTKALSLFGTEGIGKAILGLRKFAIAQAAVTTGSLAAAKAMGVMQLAMFGIRRAANIAAAAVARLGAIFKTSLGIVGLVAAAVGVLIYTIIELEAATKRQATEAGIAAVQNEKLRESYTNQVQALEGMEKGSKKYTATAKNMRTQLLEVAKNNKDLTLEATKAAHSIDEMSGEFLDGGKAMDAFIERSKQLANENMIKRVDLLTDRLNRQRRVLVDFTGSVKLAWNWWKKLLSYVPGGKTPAEVAKEQADETKRLAQELEATNIQYIKMLEKQGEFDPTMNAQQTIAYFQIIQGLAEDRATSLAKTLQLMQREAVATRQATQQVKELSLDELKTSINSTAGEVNRLGDEYEEAARKSRIAAAEFAKLSPAAREGATALREENDRLLKEQNEAYKKLQAEEENYNNQIVKLKTELTDKTKDTYDKQLKALERQKELGAIREFEYNNQVADIQEARARAELENVRTVQDKIAQIRAESQGDLSVGQGIARQVERANAKVLEAEQKAKDARIIQANAVKDAIIEAEREAEGIRVDLMEEGVSKFEAQRDRELEILKKDALARGIEWEKMGQLELAITQKYQKEIDDYKKDQAEKIQDTIDKIQERTKDEPDTLQGQQQAELEALKLKHQAELDALGDFEGKKDAVKEIYAAQEIERQKKVADHEKQMWELRKEVTYEAVDNLVEATSYMFGKQSKVTKTAFALQKAVAIRETLMSAYEGAQKAFTAFAELGPFGVAIGAAQAAIALAAGLSRVAMIRQQTLAEGGEVKGHSPHSKADNIPIWANAKEFMQPVSSVMYYGRDVMEAMRRKMIPKELFSGLPIPAYSTPSSPSRRRFATGGQVGAGSRGGAVGAGGAAPAQQKQEIKIMNYVDQREMLAALGSPDGENTLINVISSNRDKIQRVLR